MLGPAVLAALVGFASVAIAQDFDDPANARCVDGRLARTDGADLKPGERAQPCVIGGRVVDENGDAVQSVLVSAQPVAPDKPSLWSTFTDDHGEFHLSVPTGAYYVVATTLGGMDDQPEIHTDGTSGAPYARTYYPSAPDKAGAAMVAAGSNSAGLVIRLARGLTGPSPPSASTDQKTASVVGGVFNAITGAPVPRVHISLRDFDDGVQRLYGAMTKPDGTFSITGAPEGTYGVEARRVGFASPQLRGTSVTVRRGQREQDLRLPLMPTSAITGRVLDADGAPVDHATVSARGKVNEGSDTDLQGHFRIGGLLPGSYRIEASPAPPSVRPSGATQPRSTSATYPSRVAVGVVSDAGGIEVRLPRTPAIRVSGRVTGVPPGARVTLTVNSRKGGFSDSPKADGTFAYWGLEPGTYIIRAQEGVGSSPLVIDGARTPASAMVRVTVAGTNIDNLELRIRPPSDIPGRVKYEAGAVQRAAGGRFWLTDLDRMADATAALSADGHFTLEHIPPGRYRVSCDREPPAYIESMRLGSTEIQGDILDLSDGSGGRTLNVFVSSRFGHVSGAVQGNRAAVADLKVALVAVTSERDLSPRFADIGADGRYSFDSVVPGNYRLAAVDENDLVIQGADGLQEYEGVVEMVTVRGGESAITNPKLLKRQ
jgi:hypothetical protein